MQLKECLKLHRIIMAGFANLLKKDDFGTIVDHLALTHIIKE